VIIRKGLNSKGVTLPEREASIIHRWSDCVPAGNDAKLGIRGLDCVVDAVEM